MTHSEDDLLQALANLQSPAPDGRWESRLRERCHAEMIRRRRTPDRRLATVLLDAATGGIVLAYLASVLHFAVRLMGGN